MMPAMMNPSMPCQVKSPHYALVLVLLFLLLGRGIVMTRTLLIFPPFDFWCSILFWAKTKLSISLVLYRAQCLFAKVSFQKNQSFFWLNGTLAWWAYPIMLSSCEEDSSIHGLKEIYDGRQCTLFSSVLACQNAKRGLGHFSRVLHQESDRFYF